MSEPLWWPEHYFASRAKFIEQANRCGAAMESHNINALGPEGQSLSVDVASFISASDKHRIILASGVHGVEGFIGAAVQVQALQHLLRFNIPEHTGVILIHAANPWGFAHSRRVNEHNVDVNRNFIDFSSSQLPNPSGYTSLDPIINPRTTPSLLSETIYWLKASKLIAQHRGIKKLAGSIAAGQCNFPKGLFYSGTQTSVSCQLLQSIVQKYADEIECVTILDVHSGLGPTGKATLIANTNRIEKDRRQIDLQTLFGQPVIMDDDTANAYNANGSWSQWCQHTLSNKRFLYLCVEIGTVNPIKLFSALRRENQAHHWSNKMTRSNVQAKEALLKVFSPESLHWRKRSVTQGLRPFKISLDLPPAY